MQSKRCDFCIGAAWERVQEVVALHMKKERKLNEVIQSQWEHIMRLEAKKKEEELSNIIKLHTDGEGPDNDNWLAGLAEGSIFLSRKKAEVNPQTNALIKPMLLEQWEVDAQCNGATLLYTNLMGSQQGKIWVDTLMFSRSQSLVTVLAKVEKED